MANRSGRNSVFEFGGFGHSEVPYGEKAQAAALQKTAPIAGAKAANEMLGTPAKAAALGREKGAKPPLAAPPQQEPVVPPRQQPQPPLSPTQQMWQAIAAEPGASPLVQAYARGQA